MVPQRRPEYPRLPHVITRPHTRLRLPVLLILRLPQHRRPRPHLLNPVQLPSRICPRRPPALHHLMPRIHIPHLMRIMRPVTMRRHPAELEPFLRPVTITMHRTVNHHPRLPFLVRLQNPLRPLRILHVRIALVVHNHIVRRRPVRIPIHLHLRRRRRVRIQKHRELHIRPLLHPLRNQIRLRRIIMAAPPGDIQHLQRLDSTSRQHRSSQQRSNNS